jgi:hypothetical protein
MFTKSDLVVIAMPIGTVETKEHTTLKEIEVEVAGLSTEFQVRLVLKGDKQLNKFVLHHYKLEHEQAMINGPNFVVFDSKPWPKRYLLFLLREPDGRYAPVTDQTDPALYSIIKLETDAM